MRTLLVQSCSATKHRVDNPVPALELYDGYFFRIIKKALRAGRFQCGTDIIIISAKHGVVEPADEIHYYDQRMTTERAAELNDAVVDTLREKIATGDYDNVWINLGRHYLPAIDGLKDSVDVPIRHIDGSGIGLKGKRLKRLVSRHNSLPAHGD